MITFLQHKRHLTPWLYLALGVCLSIGMLTGCSATPEDLGHKLPIEDSNRTSPAPKEDQDKDSTTSTAPIEDQDKDNTTSTAPIEDQDKDKDNSTSPAPTLEEKTSGNTPTPPAPTKQPNHNVSTSPTSTDKTTDKTTDETNNKTSTPPPLTEYEKQAIEKRLAQAPYGGMISQLAENLNVSEIEATRWLLKNDYIGAFKTIALGEFRDTYAGMWSDPGINGKVYFAFTKDAQATVEAILKKSGTPLQVVPIETKYTLDELRIAESAAISLLQEHLGEDTKIWTTPDYKRSHVRIGVLQDREKAAKLLQETLGDIVRVVGDDEDFSFLN